MLILAQYMPSISESAPLLTVSELSLERGGRVLFEGLSFSVSAGEIVQITGKNGAGKTSLLRVLAGLSRFGFSGQLQCQGQPLLRHPLYGQIRLYLGHLSAVKGVLTPRENLRWHSSGQGRYNQRQIDDALDTVGLFGYEDVPCHSLSAGQQRRVNLARLYLTKCPLWLLDEPFTAIDAAGVAALEQHIAAHAGAGGAVLLTSHQPLSDKVRQIDLAGGAQ